MAEAEDIIKQFNLQPLEFEGGYFRQTYVSENYCAGRPLSTAIFYLITDEAKGFSRLHMLPIDELWHFYLGDPVKLLVLPEGKKGRQTILGRDVFNGQQLRYTVPAGTWQGARLLPGGSWALLGTTTVPGFLEKDFRVPDSDSLISRYPEWKEEITDLLWQE